MLGEKKKVRRICPFGNSLLNYFHPMARAKWKRALAACLFAYDAAVRAPVRRDGAWAVFGLKRIKVSVERGRIPHCGHIHTPVFRIAKAKQRGKKKIL